MEKSLNMGRGISMAYRKLCRSSFAEQLSDLESFFNGRRHLGVGTAEEQEKNEVMCGMFTLGNGSDLFLLFYRQTLTSRPWY
jgi:hypothetical protein